MTNGSRLRRLYPATMLGEFLTENRKLLIARCRVKVAKRRSGESVAELEHGVTLFLDQLIRTLQLQQSGMSTKSAETDSHSLGGALTLEIRIGATKHGRELLVHGFSLDDVVHDYGDLCQAITELAAERDASVSVDEFRTLNRCLDDAIADAVVEFAYSRDANAAEKTAKDLNIRLGTLAHELRNHLHTATLALSSIKSGAVALNGATGAVLDRSLIGLRNIIDRSLADVRVEAGIPAAHRKLFSLSEFIRQSDACLIGCRGTAMRLQRRSRGPGSCHRRRP